MICFETETLSQAGGRPCNEDCCGFLLQDTAGCWVLADGLGGRAGGEAASGIAVEAILSHFSQNPQCSPQALSGALEAANHKLHRRQAAEPQLAQMRTTAVVLLTDRAGALWAHVGDSRLYAFHQGALVAQTRDHSVPQSLSDAGRITPREIRFHPDRNRLLRALGNNGAADPSILSAPRPLALGDAFLLCTDGFWEYVTETEMEIDFACSSTPADWLDRMHFRLLQRAGEGHDNYTAVAIFATANRRDSAPDPVAAVPCSASLEPWMTGVPSTPAKTLRR